MAQFNCGQPGFELKNVKLTLHEVTIRSKLDTNLVGRGGEIRTHDPLYPKQVRYQTAPRPDTKASLCNQSKKEKGLICTLKIFRPLWNYRQTIQCLE